MKNQIDRAFEAMGLYDLRKYAESKWKWIGGQEDEFDIYWEDRIKKDKVSFWKSSLNYFKERENLRKQVVKLQRDLLVYKQIAKDSGRIGLDLFNQNEAMEKVIKDLRSQISDPIKYEEGINYLSEVISKANKEIKELKEKNEILKRTNERIMKVVNDDIIEKLRDV